MKNPKSAAPTGLRVPALIALLSLAAVAFMGKSYETTLRGIDSNIHAAVSMSVTSGPGLAPRLPIPIKNFSAASAAPAQRPEGAIDPNRVFNDHPFPIFWLNGLIMRALGPSGWSARLLTGLFSVGSVGLTYLIGIELGGSTAFGLLAGLLLVFCRDFILTSATVSLDTALVFAILLTFLLWLRGRWLALGLAAGIGLWIKTPLVLLVFPTAAACWALEEKRRRKTTDLTKLALALGIALVTGSLVWVYTGARGGWDLVADYWIRQLWGTAVGGRSGLQGDGGWDWGSFFIFNVRTGFLPGLPFLVWALARIARARSWRRPAVAVPLAATLITGLTVTVMRFKMGHYFTPIFPFLALLSAHSIGDWLRRHEARFEQVLTAATPALLAWFLIWPVSFGPEGFVALRRFVPYIQTEGSCDDVIALIPGGEPVGADLDEQLFLNFYTGRTIEVLPCDRATDALEAPTRPQWVIASDENLKTCLSPRARARYPRQLLSGTQYLLSRRADGPHELDLTPLDLDTLAVIDCQAPPYPHDLWHKYLSKP